MPSVTLDNRCHIVIDGEDAELFLHNLVTTDITGLVLGELRPGALLTAQGKVMFAFLIGRVASGFMIEVANQDAVEFAKKLKFFRLRAKAIIGDPQPVEVSICWDAPKPEGTYLRDARFGSTNVWRGVGTPSSHVGDALWTQLRIENGVAEPRLDYTYGDVFPHDINLDQTAGLSFSKGCYVGQEVVSRMHHRSTARWRLMVAQGDGLEQGAEIIAGGKTAGTLGSVARGSAMALVRLDRTKDALNKGERVEAGGQPISLSFPIGVSYDWPKAAEVST